MNSVFRAAGFGLAGLAMVGFLWLMAWGIFNKSPVTGLSGFMRVGRPAPDFTLPLLDKGDIVLSELQGRPLVINFWNPFCVQCREEARGLERAWRAYKDDGVVFVGVDTPMIPDSGESARAYIKEFGVTYPNGRDADGRITVDYGVIGLPVTFFVNGEGVVERRWVGAIPEAQLMAWVGELAAGVKPSGETEGENLESYFEPELDG